ncbi:hypothetical protein F4820DRAFT_422024 [Hypoxylon rubiginosum]|uniref:Uncharacterized protein n=1 Tax=Hypoxylon rubiginosum TaxID=110542 RepID=A0ACB9Z0Z4_9PEZI|nr:hypothetical protein F4820DRAFT_422024 [Hypoxylon rubiginosum]
MSTNTSDLYASPSFVIAVGVVFPVLSTIAVALRFWARNTQKAPLLIDDWLLVIAAAMNIGLGICIIIGVAGRGFAYHTRPPSSDEPDAYLHDVTPEHILISQLIYAVQVLGTFAFGCTKLSIVYFYRRIFCSHYSSNFLSKATWGVIYFLYIWIVAFLLGFIFDCGVQFWSNWGPLINDFSYCYSTFGLTAAFTISDVLSDFVVILLPIRTIWKLQMSVAQKILITCIFILGTLTIVTSVARLTLFAIWYFEGTEYLRDINIVYTEFIFWITITSSLGIITACLPTLRILLKKLPLRYLRRSFSSFKSTLWKGSSSRTWFRFNSHSTESVLPHSQGQTEDLEFSQITIQTSDFDGQSKFVS